MGGGTQSNVLTQGLTSVLPSGWVPDAPAHSARCDNAMGIPQGCAAWVNLADAGRDPVSGERCVQPLLQALLVIPETRSPVTWH